MEFVTMRTGSLLDFDRTFLVTFILETRDKKETFAAYCYAGQLPTAGRKGIAPFK